MRAFAAKDPPLAPHYEHWLRDEVSYLITSDERSLFLSLKADVDRDKFIETFWRARNPNPNAPTNTFKEEHYRRLEYANEHFSAQSFQNGWQSDRGMAYITLGEPQQRQRFTETRELRPLEIWFYQNQTEELPVHFYLIFFKESPAEDYRLYSPFGDRPQKLINSTNAVNDDPAAIKLIQRDINNEAAHIALSLIPGEPVSLKDATVTLQSDAMLNNIRNYRNLPSVRSRLNTRYALLEGVSYRLLLDRQFSDLTAVTTRDPAHKLSVHYLLRFLHPEDFTLSRLEDGRYYYSLRVEAEIKSADGKVVYHDSQVLSDYMSRDQYLKVQNKCFGVEGRLPISPGKYDLHLNLTNLLSKQAFQQDHSVLAPDEGRLGISQVFFAASAPPLRDSAPNQPFSFSGVKLAPIGSDKASVTQGDPLRLLMQIWEAPGDPAALHGKMLEMHYMIGKMNTEEKQEEDQRIDRGTFDPSGNLLIGKDLRTDDLAPGVYRLVVRARDTDSSTTAYQSLNFEVVDSSTPAPALWTITVPQAKLDANP